MIVGLSERGFLWNRAWKDLVAELTDVAPGKLFLALGGNPGEGNDELLARYAYAYELMEEPDGGSKSSYPAPTGCTMARDNQDETGATIRMRLAGGGLT
jgi:hypothetical protein